MANKRKVDIIFNTTLVCPWNCDVCCVDAVHVKKRGKVVELISEGRTKTTVLTRDREFGSVYDQALAHRQSLGLELTLEKKMRIIDHLDGFDAKIDVSGGDALSVSENFEFLKYACEKLGRHNVTLTVTGAGSSSYTAAEISKYVGEYNFTFDAESLSDVALRPDGYALGNLKKARAFVKQGISTRAETPLTKSILNREHLERLYLTLRDAGITKLLLMRLFPVGRGVLHEDEIPTADQYRFAIDVLQQMERTHSGPIVKVQCAMKHLAKIRAGDGGNPCDLVTESFGLMADGTFLASPWAIGGKGKPLAPEWVLGNLERHTLADILAGPKAQAFHARADENFGHCKIFAYLNSKKENRFDRIFDKADPLYAENPDQVRKPAMAGGA